MALAPGLFQRVSRSFSERERDCLWLHLYFRLQTLELCEVVLGFHEDGEKERN